MEHWDTKKEKVHKHTTLKQITNSRKNLIPVWKVEFRECLDKFVFFICKI